jgi:hypothetical protein
MVMISATSTSVFSGGSLACQDTTWLVCRCANWKLPMLMSISFACCREMTRWSILVSNLRVSASLLLGGCNLMAPDVWSHQSSLVMWAGLRPRLSSGHSMLKVLQSVPWRACWLALSPFSIALLLGMTRPGTYNYLYYPYAIWHQLYVLQDYTQSDNV